MIKYFKKIYRQMELDELQDFSEKLYKEGLIDFILLKELTIDILRKRLGL